MHYRNVNGYAPEYALTLVNSYGTKLGKRFLVRWEIVQTFNADTVINY